MKKDAPYYLMKGWGKMKGLFQKEGIPQPIPQAEMPEQHPDTDGQVNPEPFDYTAWQITVRDGLVNHGLDIVNDKKDCAEKDLQFFIDNENLLIQAKENGLDSYLNDWLEYKKGVRFRTIELLPGKPSSEGLQTSITEEVCLMVKNGAETVETPADMEKLPEEHKPQKAVITVLAGCCAFKEGKTELMTDKERTWNIGFGDFTNFNGRMVRYNQIALQYAQPEGREKDPYPISRAHAHITYKPGVGFAFFVDPRGVNKRTAVQKGEKVHRITDVRAGVRLEDGDIIILNNEMLLFRYT